MQTLRPSPDWQVLLEPFPSLFTPSGFRYFRACVLVLAHLDGRLWVTQVILADLLSRHYTNFYRFLEQRSRALAAHSSNAVTAIWPVGVSAVEIISEMRR